MGVDKTENLTFASISSALERVFSGGKHQKLIFDEATLLNVFNAYIFRVIFTTPNIVLNRLITEC